MDQFIEDEITLTAAACVLAGAADRLKRIGDTVTLSLWAGKVSEEVLTPIFWPYLMAEFSKLSKYKDFKADIEYPEHAGQQYTAIKITYITAKQSIDVIGKNKERSE